MGQRIGLAIAAIAIGLSVFFFTKTSPSSDEEGFKFFKTHCRLYDRSGNLLFSFDQHYMCDFKSDGSFIASNPNSDELVYYDKNDKIVWQATENDHHDVNFSDDEQRIQTITTEIINLNGKKTRSDCLMVRDTKGLILKKWCLSDHLQELEKLGIDTSKSQELEATNKSPIANTDTEIVHTNSFYEIPENMMSAENPAFKKGNYIVNFYSPLALTLILDSDLKQIVWYKLLCFDIGNNFSVFLYTHDMQITRTGRLLAYINYIGRPKDVKCHSDLKDVGKLYGINTEPMKPNLLKFLNNKGLNLPFRTPGRFYTSINEFDVQSGAIVWNYTAPDFYDFDAQRFGGITLLNNNHYLISDITKGNRVFEVDPNGKTVWSLNLDNFYLTIKSAKPFYATGFFKARGISTAQ